MKVVGAILLLWFVLVACGSEPDIDACEARLRQVYSEGQTLANRPVECNGVDQATLERIVGDILDSAPPPGLR